MKKKVGILFLLLGIIMLGSCNNTADTTQGKPESFSETSSIESEVISSVTNETSSLTAEQQKLQDSFNNLTNNGSNGLIVETAPLVYEVHYKVSWNSAVEETSYLADSVYTQIDDAVTEAYGEHDPITVRIYDENNNLVATNETSENYWEMQTVA